MRNSAKGRNVSNEISRGIASTLATGESIGVVAAVLQREPFLAITKHNHGTPTMPHPQ